MAVMQRCCCFDNVRAGSIASAIYTLIYSAIVLAYAAWQIAVYAPLLPYIRANGFFIAFCFCLALVGLILIFSILVLIGVSQDQRGYLFPYMIVMPILILLHAAQCILYIVGIAGINSYGYDPRVSASIAALCIVLAVIVLLIVLDVFCFLCVVSQYQELRDGRGRLQDVTAARTQTIMTATNFVGVGGGGGGGAVIVTQTGGIPPQGYPTPGYPPPGYAPQGYPPKQGYYPSLQE